MINLYYSEAYWGHSATMNGPHKVINNLIKSLDQEKIDYAINEEKYEHNFLVQYDATAHDKHSKICLLYTSPSPRDRQKSRMPSSA